MITIQLVLFILALVCFFVTALRGLRGAAPDTVVRRIDLLALDLFFWLLATMVKV